jgi:hypothetical protein
MNSFTSSVSPTRPLPRWVWFLLLGSSACLLAYTGYRSAFVAMTFDEIWSLNQYASASWGDIFGFKPVSANNHLGNTVLMKLCLKAFGNSPFALRLPNLLAHVLYLAFSIALARRLRQGVWVLLAFFLLNFHPFLLDFFSLARGYGLAMAMLMGSLYHLYGFRENAFSRHILWNVAFAALSVLFNFSFLHFFLADAVVLTMLIYSHTRAWNGEFRVALLTAIKRLFPIVLATVVLYLVMRAPVKALVEAKELFYGGSTGFWSDTVFSMAHSVLYKIDYWRHDVDVLLKFCMVSLFAMLVTFGIELGDRGGRLRESPGMLALLLLLLPAVIGTVQHYEVGSLFLIYRTALFLLPIYMLGLVWLLRTIARIPEFRKVIIGISVSITLLLAVHNANALNLTHCTEWQCDADTQTMLEDLQADRLARGDGGQSSIGVSWQVRPGTNYYRKYLGLDWLAEAKNNGCQPGLAYYFVVNGDPCGLPPDQLPFGEKQGCVLLKTYPISNTSLWRGPARPE